VVSEIICKVAFQILTCSVVCQLNKVIFIMTAGGICLPMVKKGKKQKAKKKNK
jgi:hypothetical protein